MLTVHHSLALRTSSRSRGRWRRLPGLRRTGSTVIWPG